MKKKLIFSITPVLFLLLLIGATELWLRAQPRTIQEAEFVFFTEFKISRWRYLNKLRGRLLIDQVLRTEPNSTHIEPPEANRPPFDRVPYPYEVHYNNFGFRDQDFDINTKERKRVLLLGDSVSFGKGVTLDERYSSLIQQERPDLEVWNLGLQGCTAECMARLLDEHIMAFNPDIMIIQASGNDIDQTLWNVATSKQISAMSVEALRWVRSYRVLEYWVQKQGKEGLQVQLDQAHTATQKRYGPDIHKLFSWAESKEIPIISLNLPFAYGYHYGEHQSRICEGYKETCSSNIRFVFSTEQPPQEYRTKEYIDFVQATAQEFSVKEGTINNIFLYRNSFHDVCHLSPWGHRQVADKLLIALKDL
ncbi:MAG: hypothetical protein CL916_03410 [Deltaproteobacteria bacterium]|nr:hypothetical protein [Deltaproteobacteria bacterium]